ncbi:MAG TPA: DNA mismatch repair protein MutS [Pirellulales bacterium]|jgi:DNA mismatch repair protein MutS|nr:DNA mismatch repair protein MutS [Pirellulales bacterium]
MLVSPMMQQYEDAKAACPDALLLFRMGDFYELFHEDAREAARVLGLALTSRDKGEKRTPMAGFPYHQLDAYLGKLIAAGFRVAICEQVEDAKAAKGLVRREVTRIVTAGTVTDDALLDPRTCNFLAAVLENDTQAGIAWVELSTGKFQAACFPRARLSDELARIAPAECLASEEARAPSALGEGVRLTRRPAWSFSDDIARNVLCKHFAVSTLDGFGFEDGDTLAVCAAGAVLGYLVETQKASLAHIQALARYSPGATLEIDGATRRSLEITCTLRDGARAGSLLGVIDRTVTAMGSRLLADWLANPLVAASAIDKRLDAVAELVAEPALCDVLVDHLRAVYDLERLVARVVTLRASPRDLSFVCRTLARLPQVKAKIAARHSALLTAIEGRLDLCCELRASLERALADECPLVSREGGFIRDGYSSELDGLRDLTSGGKRWIAEYQAAEAERSGIANLKVGFNKVFGYYLEVTHARGSSVPGHYIRKQTVKNAERYITPELKEHEERVLAADEQARELEYTLFCQLREEVAAHAPRLQRTAGALAELDVLVGLADLARKRGYCRPTMVEESILQIVDGRHPVLDSLIGQGAFVPNDLCCGGADGFSLLVTGPNMAGKSTFIRQVALMTLLAQMGSFVPARSATIGIADRIFARVGASDELARGQSTFMVEMTETARILNLATPRSLVILDEIGRGTSTYDGLSLAWAVVEFLHDRVGCRTLFATHYHELTQLAGVLTGLRNLNVAVREWEDDVVFLHKILPGAADKSYGIHVARLAGVPGWVLERAKQILAQLENEHLDAKGRAKLARTNSGSRANDLQLSLFAAEEHPMIEALRLLQLDETSPRAAHDWLAEWKERIRG